MKVNTELSNSALAKSYITGSVTSKDGTTIGYRQMGQGPGVILVHGGLQSSESFMQLATALSDDFTVYVPDRRGRGLSGPFGDSYCIQRDVEDIEALVNKTDAHNLFGLSSGAVISLNAALALTAIHRLAVYEPPLSTNGSTDFKWLPRYEQEVAQGKLGAAMVSVLKGTRDTSFLSQLPRFIITKLFNLAVKQQPKEGSDDTPLSALIPTFQYDAQIVKETENTLDTFRNLSADVLLLGGSKSAAYLKAVLDQLSTVLPHVQRIEFPGFDHIAASNGGHPEQVAQELRRFFQQRRVA